MPVSFAPKDFSSGRWQGGHATIHNPRFEYAETNFGNGPETQVELHLEYMDDEGTSHSARFRVGGVKFNSAVILTIRESADPGADVADVGPAFSHADPSKQYRLHPQSEASVFFANLVAGGFSESKLESGDVSVLDGVEVDVAPKAKKEGDKFPLLMPTKVYSKGGAASGKQTSKAPAAKKTAAGADDAAELATELVNEALKDAKGPMGVSDVIRFAVSKLKGNPLKASVVDLLGNKEFLDGGTWTFDGSDMTIM